MADLLGTWYRDAVGAVLRRTGPIPRHVAFIMDGNRRYARQRGLIGGGAGADGGLLSSRVVEGHRAGYAAMVDAVGWCLSLGVTHVTLYAFSLDNYGRSPEEVADLMDLAATKYGELAAAEGFKMGVKGKGGVKGNEKEAEEGSGEADRSRRRRSRSCSGGGGKKKCGSGRRRRRRRQADEEVEEEAKPQPPAAARPPPPPQQNNANASWRGAEVRILGNLDTAPTSVRQAAARLMRATRAYGLGEDEEEEEEEEDSSDEGDSSSGSDDDEEDDNEAATTGPATTEQQQPAADPDSSDDGFDARAEALLHGEPGPLPSSRLNSPLGSGRYDSPSGSSPPASASPLPRLSLSPAPSPPNKTKGQRRYRPSASSGRHQNPQPRPQPQQRRRLRRRRPPIVNICFAYTSTDELRAAVTDVRSALKRLQLLPGDVDARLLLAAMHTRECPPVDLVLRTSGEQRLSDFVVWQASCAQVQVLPCLWPEITFARLARCFSLYQRHARELTALRAAVAQGGGAPAVVEVRGTGEDDDDDEEGGGGYHALGLPMTASLLDEGGGAAGAGGGGAAAGAGPPQRTSSFLSSISEDEPTLAPHPHVALRVAGFLRSLDARRGAWVARHTR